MGIKHFLFRLLGKDPDAVVVSFLSGPDDLALRMLEEVRTLIPDRQHFAVGLRKHAIAGVTCLTLEDLPGALRAKRIGMAPALIRTGPEYDGLRRAAWSMAPGKILAYNPRLERHHLQLRCWIASLLFYRGVPLDRIHLRPWWLVPWKKDRSRVPDTFESFEGRALIPGKPLVAIVSPYFPYPLSHGGAVRIYHLLREAAKDFNLILFAFAEKTQSQDLEPVLQLCRQVFLIPNPRYREPRWSSLSPPEVREFDVPVLRRLLKESRFDLLQAEYTQMAQYGPDVLVEHDVTFDLFRQVYKQDKTVANWWNWWRWQRYEKRALKRSPGVVVMSEKDRQQAGGVIIPNGVDLSRFQPVPEKPGRKILFVGSFRHFPNVVAYRFFTEEVWPIVQAQVSDAELTVVAGPDPELYLDTPPPSGVNRLGFVRDVKPLYDQTNLVVVPTRVSAGTNLKVLEAMAMDRAVVSTTSGCAGLGLEHGSSVWVADTAAEFAQATIHLLQDDQTRKAVAAEARAHALRHFDWEQIGRLQKELWDELLHTSRQ